MIVPEAGRLLFALVGATRSRRRFLGPASGSALVCRASPRSDGNTRAPGGSGPSEGHTGGNGSVVSGFLAASGPLSRCGGVSGSGVRLCVLCGVCSPVSRSWLLRVTICLTGARDGCAWCALVPLGTSRCIPHGTGRQWYLTGMCRITRFDAPARPPPKALHQSGLTTGRAFMASRSSPKTEAVVYKILHPGW